MPELGLALPGVPDAVLPPAQELVIFDTVTAVADAIPVSDDGMAEKYLDLLADAYLVLDRPIPSYHNWPSRADEALRERLLSKRVRRARPQAYQKRMFRW